MSESDSRSDGAVVGTPADHGFAEPATPTPPPPQVVIVQRAPSTLARTWGVVTSVLRSLRASDPVTALRLGAEAPATIGKPHAFWSFVFFGQAALVGLFGTLLFSKVYKEVFTALASVVGGFLGSIVGGFDSVFGDAAGSSDLLGDLIGGGFSALSGAYAKVPTDTSVQIFFGTLVVAAVFLVLRALAVKLTFSRRSAAVSFAQSAGIVAVAVAPMCLIPLAGVVVTWLPGWKAPLVAMVLVAIASTALVVAAEVVIYVGLNRTVRFTTSVLVPHALLSAAWLGTCVLVTYLLAKVFL